MITEEQYKEFKQFYDSGGYRYYNPQKAITENHRFGQAFMHYFKITGEDADLFFSGSRALCEEIIEQRYLHPAEQ